MTMTPKNGGPAFPCAETQRMAAHDGMTLRDYFAGQALVGMMTANQAWYDEAADFAYRAADAMIKAREASE